MPEYKNKEEYEKWKTERQKKAEENTDKGSPVENPNVKNPLIMKRVMIWACLVTVPLLIAGGVYVGYKKSEYYIKKEFVKAAGLKIEELKQQAQRLKGEPCTPSPFNPPSEGLGSQTYSFSGVYIEYLDGYQYNVIKSASIISPYIGTVELAYNSFHKKGPTQYYCDMAEWASNKEIRKRTLDFAYQDGQWVFKQ